MTQMTIDFGIDLGTTNSVVARLRNMVPEIFKNNDNSECTPSVVMIPHRRSHGRPRCEATPRDGRGQRRQRVQGFHG